MASEVKKPAKTLEPLIIKKTGKSKKQSAVFKNLLTQTFPKYWPQLQPNYVDELFEILIRAKSTYPSWFSTKRSAESRPVYYGLQSSCKKIQSDEVRLLVISADLHPRFIVHQMILKAISTNPCISILIVSGLNVRIQSIVDFSCFAFVITAAGWQQLTELNAWCTNIVCTQFPIPDAILTYYEKRRDALADSNDIDMDDASMLREKCTDDPIFISNYHLPKDINQRAFVPQNAADLKPVSYHVQSFKRKKSDFISLDLLDSGGSNKITKKAKKALKMIQKQSMESYQPLVIHKVQNSSGNRLDKKTKKNKKSA